MGDLVQRQERQWLCCEGAKDPYKNNEVFFPATGYANGSDFGNAGVSASYWSSTPQSDLSMYAWCLYFDSGTFFENYSYRYRGYQVRPVRDAQ